MKEKEQVKEESKPEAEEKSSTVFDEQGLRFDLDRLYGCFAYNLTDKMTSHTLGGMFYFCGEK